MRRSVFLLALFIVSWVYPADAHEVRPGYLELREVSPGRYDVLWKVPARGDLRLGLYVRFPENCQPITLPIRYGTQGAFTERWSIACAGGLTGRTITIDGLSATLTDVLARLERYDGTTHVAMLTPSAPSLVVEAAPSQFQVTGTYLRLGIEHILFGIDHLFFVLALLLIVSRTWLLVKTITAFTVAHSLTLGLATLGFVHVQPKPVEAVIALSILFVAAEIVHGRQGRQGLAARAPWIVAFVFGLLHGFGFAGALSEVGLPAGHIPLALLCFNAGVEIGQLLFISVVLTLRTLIRRVKITVPLWAQLVPAYIIGSAAMFWVIQRVAAF